MATQVNTPRMMAIQGRKGSGGEIGQAVGTIAGGIVGGIASGGNPAGVATGAGLGGSLGGAIGGATGDKGTAGSQGLSSPTIEAARRRADVTPQTEDPVSAVENARSALANLPEEQQKEFGPILAAGSRALRSRQNA